MTTNTVYYCICAAGVLLLLLCLAPMPYGFYILTRFAIMGIACYLGYDFYKAGNKGYSIVAICIALLFQPFIKISLGRVIWNVVDIIVAILLIVCIIKKYKH